MRKGYEGYKSTGIAWTPQIPAHWNVARLKTLLKTHFSGAWGEEPNGVEDFLCIRIADFHFDRVCVSKEIPTLRRFTREQVEKKVLHDGDLLLEKSGGGEKTRVGRVVQFIDNKNKSVMCSNFIECLRPNVIRVNSSYLTFLLKSLYLLTEMNGYFKQTIGIQNVDMNAYLATLLPIPPREEQDQIARFLDWKVSSINKLISSYRNQIALLDEMKQRKIDEAVVKGIRKSTIVHNDDIRWDIYYPEHWQIRRTRELFSFRKGLSITKANLEETGIAVISYGQIHSQKNTGVSLNEDLFRYVNKSYLQTNKSCLVEKGDFIFADTSEDVIGCGNCAYIDRDGTIFAGYHSIIAHPSGSTNNKYLAYLFKSPTWRYQIRKKVNGVKVYSITQKMLKDTFILIPPSDEQEEIAGYLDEICIKIDVAIQKLEEKISNLQDLKTRLIADVVTGQMDVRDITVPEYEHVDEISADGSEAESEESEDFNEEED